jgi:uncharacterized protein
VNDRLGLFIAHQKDKCYAVRMTTQAVTEVEIERIASAVRMRAQAIASLGATAVYIYGSRARGDHRQDSDLEVMIDYAPGKLTVLKLMAIKHLIQDETGLDTHISTRDSFTEANARRFEADLVRVL